MKEIIVQSLGELIKLHQKSIHLMITATVMRLYKLDSDLQAAHANFPWIVTFDDHEVDNNYAGDIPQDPQKQTNRRFLKKEKLLPIKPIMNICRFAVPLCQMEVTSKYIVAFPLGI